MNGVNQRLSAQLGELLGVKMTDVRAVVINLEAGQVPQIEITRLVKELPNAERRVRQLFEIKDLKQDDS